MRFMRIIGVLLGLSMLIVANSQAYYLNAKIDSNEIIIGDQVDYLIEFKGASQILAFLPNKLNELGHIEVVDIKKDSTVKDNESVYNWNLTITSFDTGYFEIPSIPVFVFNNNKDTLFTSPQNIRVNGIKIPEGGGPQSVKPIFNFPIPVWEILYYAVLVILATGLVFVTILMIRNKLQKRPVFEFKRPEIPPHIVAFEALDKLKKDKLWQQGHIKEYYTRLTQIIRTYLEKRYNINALEKTSDEIIDSLVAVGFNDKALLNQLKNVFSVADLVKFAKNSPLPDQNEACYMHIHSFINETRPVEELDKEADNKPESGEGENNE